MQYDFLDFCPKRFDHLENYIHICHLLIIEIANYISFMKVLSILIIHVFPLQVMNSLMH